MDGDQRYGQDAALGLLRSCSRMHPGRQGFQFRVARLPFNFCLKAPFPSIPLPFPTLRPQRQGRPSLPAGAGDALPGPRRQTSPSQGRAPCIFLIPALSNSQKCHRFRGLSSLDMPLRIGSIKPAHGALLASAGMMSFCLGGQRMLGLNVVDVAAVACTQMCRAGDCPLHGGGAPEPRPAGCQVPGAVCTQASLMAWTEAILRTAREDSAAGTMAVADSAPAPSDSSVPQMLAVADVAGMLGISASSVRRLVRAGTLPQPLRLGGSVRWRRAEVEAVALGRSTSRSSQTSSGEVPRRRGGGGRPKGSKNKSTLEYEAWLAQRGRGGNTAA